MATEPREFTEEYVIRPVGKLHVTVTDRNGNLPYVAFRNDGRTIAWDRQEYVLAATRAHACGCGRCDDCVAVAYHQLQTGRRLP